MITTQSSNPAAPCGTYLSLAQLDRVASCVAHLLFVIFRKSGSGFVPAQNYYNTQITLRTKYVSQAVSMAEKIVYYWWYQDADDRLENMFGMLRVLETGVNFDMVQFEDRASVRVDVTRCDICSPP